MSIFVFRTINATALLFLSKSTETSGQKNGRKQREREAAYDVNVVHFTRPDIKLPQPFQRLDHPYHPFRPLCPVRDTQVLKMGKKFRIERIVHDAVANN